MKKILETAKIVGRQIQNVLQMSTTANVTPLYENDWRLWGPSNNSGSHKCCRVHPRGCHCCQIINESKTFASTNTGKVYFIRQNINCRSSFVIYLGTCQKCKGQYVGKSKNEFRVRHSGHKQQIRKNAGGFGQHYHQYNGCGYHNLTVTLIEQVEKDIEKLHERELFWQHRLRAFHEHGGNAHCVRNYAKGKGINAFFQQLTK